MTRQLTTLAKAGSRVAVLGASPKEDRYSFKAVRMLKEHGHKPIPIHPAGHTVDGVSGLKSLSEIDQPVDTLTVYVNSRISSELKDDIIKLNPRRVVFNPGAENENLAKVLEGAGIVVVIDCTLVMLTAGEF